MTSQEAGTAVDKTILRFRAFLPTAISAIALIGSVVSMWETTIKQAEVRLHVSDNIHFTRDPWGSYEVLIIPVTLANRGARDGTILTLSLDVKNLTTNQSKRFKSAYTADAKWFSARDDVSANLRRPRSHSRRSPWPDGVLLPERSCSIRRTSRKRKWLTPIPSSK